MRRCWPVESDLDLCGFPSTGSSLRSRFSCLCKSHAIAGRTAKLHAFEERVKGGRTRKTRSDESVGERRVPARLGLSGHVGCAGNLDRLHDLDCEEDTEQYHIRSCTPTRCDQGATNHHGKRRASAFPISRAIASGEPGDVTCMSQLSLSPGFRARGGPRVRGKRSWHSGSRLGLKLGWSQFFVRSRCEVCGYCQAGHPDSLGRIAFVGIRHREHG